MTIVQERPRVGAQAVAPDETVQAVLLEVPAEKTVDERIDEQIENMMAGSRRGGPANMVYCQEVKIYPSHVEVELKGIKKTLSLVDFKQIIDSQLQMESQLSTTALPLNTFLFARAAGEIHISCYYPERRMDLKLQERSGVKVYKNVLMPNIVISHALKMEGSFWMVQNTKYFATSMRPTEFPEDKVVFDPIPGANMWRVPFPNFYNDYRMCYGQNNMPMKHANNLRGLDYFYQVLYDSPFNFDLGINVREYDTNIPSWFEHLTTVDKFPYELMKTTTTY